MNKKRQKSKKKKWIIISAVTAAVVLLAVFLLPQFMRGNTQAAGALTKTATVSTAPSIYAQQGKCRNHAAFSTLKTIKQPL